MVGLHVAVNTQTFTEIPFLPVHCSLEKRLISFLCFLPGFRYANEYSKLYLHTLLLFCSFYQILCLGNRWTLRPAEIPPPLSPPPCSPPPLPPLPLIRDSCILFHKAAGTRSLTHISKVPGMLPGFVVGLTHSFDE